MPILHNPFAIPAADAASSTNEANRDYRYGRRWQVESTVSMIKCNLGSFVAARSNQAGSAEAMLKVLTHNIMLISRRLRELV